jgi:hypothetical protein
MMINNVVMKKYENSRGVHTNNNQGSGGLLFLKLFLLLISTGSVESKTDLTQSYHPAK